MKLEHSALVITGLRAEEFEAKVKEFWRWAWRLLAPPVIKKGFKENYIVSQFSPETYKINVGDNSSESVG